MRSTRSSDSPPGDSDPRPSRAAIIALVVGSLVIPAGALALIVTHHDHAKATVGSTGSTGTSTRPPTTEVSPIDTHKARVGSAAPNFSLATVTGTRLTLSALRGKSVVIAFFASWCHPCEQELPVLQQFQSEDAGRLTVIGVNYQDLPSDTAAFVHRLHVTFPALLEDPDGPVADRYGVRGIPQTVFVDAHGIVRGRVYGLTSRSALAPAISDLLAGRNVRAV